MTYEDIVRDVYSNSELKEFLKHRFEKPMRHFGYSDELINEFLSNIDTLNIATFDKKHHAEIESVRTNLFFNVFTKKYFEQCVVPEIPRGGKVLDVGCGRGMLIELLLTRGENEVVGIDIFDSPEWSGLRDRGVQLEVVEEKNFLEFISKVMPDIVTLTWVLHHMEYGQQCRYLQSLHSVLRKGARVVVLEDAYSEVVPPEFGHELAEDFMVWSREDRHKIMGALDWTANIIFGQKTAMPVPFAYRTLEEWELLFNKIGFKIIRKRYLGFPDNRDVDTAQSVFIAERL